jgi:hypothetical protein
MIVIHDAGRKKRQTEKQHMSPKERLVEALKWAKVLESNLFQNPIASKRLLLLVLIQQMKF